MKVYCINLDRRPDRLDYMTGLFAQHRIAFERVAAVDGQDPQVAAAAAGCGPGMYGRKMSAGAYACTQSHREVWRRLVESGAAYAMVFEDDMVVCDGIAGYLDADWIPADADLVRLETFRTRVHRARGRGIDAKGRRLYRLRSRQSGTGCYMISAKAAQRLFEATGNFADPIDEILFNEASPQFQLLTTYQMVPAPTVQGDRLATTPASWAMTSITERFARNQGIPTELDETGLARLRRRLKEEARSVLSGTRYVVVPFG